MLRETLEGTGRYLSGVRVSGRQSRFKFGEGRRQGTALPQDALESRAAQPGLRSLPRPFRIPELGTAIHGRPLLGSQPLPALEPRPAADVAGGTGQERAVP